jgi:hypothetical protein
MSSPWAISSAVTPARCATCAHSGPAAEPVAGSSPIAGLNDRARAVPASTSTALT